MVTREGEVNKDIVDQFWKLFSTGRAWPIVANLHFKIINKVGMEELVKEFSE